MAASATSAIPASGVAGFGDVPHDRFYAEAVQWMVDNDITTGTSPSCFSPEDPTLGRGGTWTIENGHLADTADIDLSAAGRLVLVPTATHHNGWFATSNGPIVYQQASGDFAAAIRSASWPRRTPTGDPYRGRATTRGASWSTTLPTGTTG
jgi:hypothetical protein